MGSAIGPLLPSRRASLRPTWEACAHSTFSSSSIVQRGKFVGSPSRPGGSVRTTSRAWAISPPLSSVLRLNSVVRSACAPAWLLESEAFALSTSNSLKSALAAGTRELSTKKTTQAIKRSFIIGYPPVRLLRCDGDDDAAACDGTFAPSSSKPFCASRRRGGASEKQELGSPPEAPP